MEYDKMMRTTGFEGWVSNVNDTAGVPRVISPRVEGDKQRFTFDMNDTGTDISDIDSALAVHNWFRQPAKTNLTIPNALTFTPLVIGINGPLFVPPAGGDSQICLGLLWKANAPSDNSAVVIDSLNVAKSDPSDFDDGTPAFGTDETGSLTAAGGTYYAVHLFSRLTKGSYRKAERITLGRNAAAVAVGSVTITLAGSIAAGSSLSVAPLVLGQVSWERLSELFIDRIVQNRAGMKFDPESVGIVRGR